MIIDAEVYRKVVSTPKDIPPETGGILGSHDGIICKYQFDEGYHSHRMCTYIPNTQLLNDSIREWKRRDIDLAGMYHTHYFGVETLSQTDIDYIKKIMDSMPDQVNCLFFPLIVMPERKMVGYIARRSEDGITIQKEHIICQ